MNLYVTTKELNASGKLFFDVGRGNEDLLEYGVCFPGKTGLIRIGYNSGIYGWNYSVYMLVKKTGVYYIISGYRNMPKRVVHWSREDLEKMLAAD